MIAFNGYSIAMELFRDVAAMRRHAERIPLAIDTNEGPTPIGDLPQASWGGSVLSAECWFMRAKAGKKSLS
jgi:hypothetical protein